MHKSIIQNLIQKFGKRGPSKIPLLVFLPVRFHNLITAGSQIASDNHIIRVIQRFHMGRHHNHVSRNLILPHNPHSRDIHDLSEQTIIAYKSVFFLVADKKKRTVRALPPADIPAHTPPFQFRCKLLYTAVIIKYSVIIFPEYINPRPRQRVQN